MTEFIVPNEDNPPRWDSEFAEADSEYIAGGAGRLPCVCARLRDAMTRLDNSRIIRAPRGTELTAKTWLTEAPLRMLMNNLDPEVAEKPRRARRLRRHRPRRAQLGVLRPHRRRAAASSATTKRC